MENHDVSKWITQPDVCRCCLSGRGTKNLTTAYKTDGEKEEVFADILSHCFGVSLSFVNDLGYSQMVCDPCANQLCDASSFHKRVLHADKCFSNYVNVRKDGEEKSNSLLTKKNVEEYTVEEFFRNDFDNLDTEIPKKTNKINKEINLKANRRKRKKICDNIYDSDTPVARFKKSSVDTDYIENVDKCTADELANRLTYNKIDISITEPKLFQRNTIKQISERRRIILTCRIVLIETTACPFRHHKSWFQCFYCTQDFMEINLLRNHILQSHPDPEAELKKIKRFPRSLQIEISSLECRHCSMDLTNVETMARHFTEVHNKVIYKECIADYKINSNPYTCHICKKEFHVFRSLTTHINVHYANCICDVCGKPFLNGKRLKVHKRIHENGTFPCTECGKVLKTKISQSNHMENAHSKRVLKCQICDKPMKHYNDRVKHMSEVHNITNKFKCTICDKEYYIKHYLATHMRQAHGHKNKKCNLCNMAFISNHALKKHMSKHTGEKPFSCSVCCKSYARNYTLREHMRAHENDKRFLGSQ